MVVGVDGRGEIGKDDKHSRTNPYTHEYATITWQVLIVQSGSDDYKQADRSTLLGSWSVYTYMKDPV